ncbi:MAG: hypothetical protein ABI135_00865 [Rhodoferax sp.]
MTWNRRNRLATVLLALMSLLFLQFAVAGYSCPGGPTAAIKAVELAAMVQTDMPRAESMAVSMDDGLPSLCHTHCQGDPQSADKYQVPGLASPAEFGIGAPLPRIVPAPLGALLQAPLLRRTTAPPLAVRNCCFRI